MLMDASPPATLSAPAAKALAAALSVAPGRKLGQQQLLLDDPMDDQRRVVRPTSILAGSSAAAVAPGSSPTQGKSVRWAQPLKSWRWFCQDDPPAAAHADAFTFDRELGTPAPFLASGPPKGNCVRWAEALEAPRFFCKEDPPAAACADVLCPRARGPASVQPPRGRSPLPPPPPLAGGRCPTGAALGSPVTRLAVHTRVSRGGRP